MEHDIIATSSWGVPEIGLWGVKVRVCLNEFTLATDQSTVLYGIAVLPDDVVGGGEEPEAMQGHVVSVTIPKPSFFTDVLEEGVQEGRSVRAFLQSLWMSVATPK